jgi:hypothetical protein
MTTFPNAPRILKGGLVLVDPGSQLPQRIIVLQINPETLSRTVQVQAAGGEGSADRMLPLRLKAPPVETIKLDAQIDATDQLEFPDLNPRAVESGIHPELAALETMLYPPSDRLISNNARANLGTLEIAPVEAPLTLFVWSKHRIVPVRITELSVTEEFFDTALNPIRAKVSLGLRVMSVSDFGFDHRGGSLFMSYLQAKERLAGLARPGELQELGLGRLP